MMGYTRKTLRPWSGRLASRPLHPAQSGFWTPCRIDRQGGYRREN